MSRNAQRLGRLQASGAMLPTSFAIELQNANVNLNHHKV
jgi:hypothetical protein